MFRNYSIWGKHGRVWRKVHKGETSMLVWISAVIAYIYSSYTDIRTREIPVYTFPAAFVITLVYRLSTGMQMEKYYIGAVIMLVVSLLYSIFAKLGGGDVIILSYTGFLLGIDGCIPFTLISSCIVLCIGIYIHVWKKKKIRGASIPMAPVFGIATLLYCLLKLQKIL